MSFKENDQLGRFDLESLEMHLRSCMHRRVGSHLLEKLLNSDDGDYRGKTIPCKEGHVFEFKEYRHKGLFTVLGPVPLKRAYYYDKECGAGQCPKDKDFGCRRNIL